MDNSAIQSLTSALDFGSARMQALSNNLSNVNTPGYKRKDVSFDTLLRAAQDPNSAADTLLRTDPRHLPLDEADAPNFAIQTQSGGSMRLDGNNVDIDKEGANLAATEIFYQGATQLLETQFSNLKYEIAGGK